ncbi:MAG: dihydrodipicolinate synthase family protein [Gemmobacter sp.]
MRPTPRLFVPAITPFHADLTVDLPRLVAFGRRLIAQGADGLAPFGTTSEAASLSVDERMRGLEALASGGIAPDCLIPGTGCAALTDTIRLTGHARALGVRGVLMLPPFYYKPVSTEGLFASFARVIEAVGPGLRVYLYHIPQMTGVPITADLIGRLDLAFPGVVAGLKDSSGNWDNTASLIAAFPHLEFYSASEALLPRNVSAGGAGCISATANVNAAGISALIGALGTAEQETALTRAEAARRAFEKLPLIPAVKAVAALQMRDPGFAHVRPPLVAPGPSHDAAIIEAAALCNGDHVLV